MKPYHYCISLLTVLFCCPFSMDGKSDLVLNYDKPAAFFEEAMVIGNGNLGAVVYGGTSVDRISLNDITLWTGEPDRDTASVGGDRCIAEIRGLLELDKYREADVAMKEVQGHYSENYQPLGNLFIEYPDNVNADVFDYKRGLDIGDAVAFTDYITSGSVMHSEYFASAPDSVIVVNLSLNSPNGLHAVLRFDSPLPHRVDVAGNTMVIEGYAAYHSYPNYYDGLPDDEKHLYDSERGVHFRTIVCADIPVGDVESSSDGTMQIYNAPEVTLYITNVTSFNGFDKDPVKNGRDYKRLASRRINRAVEKGFCDIKSDHIADYREYFDRVNLYLGDTDDNIKSKTTDRQLFDYTVSGEVNPELEVLYFQYGRYLLISSSRTQGVPANLQGLWNEKILPPWSCNYTSNINLEENYWGAETTNLSEFHMPLFGFIENLASSGNSTAKKYYGVSEGWCLGHNTDIWAMTCPVGLKGGDPSWANWNMGGAWVSTHIWEHYLFTRDKEFLKKYYPYLRGAAEFCLAWMIEKNGNLMTSPGTSPENKFVTNDGYVGAVSYGNTSDLAMIRECLIDAVEAAKVLGQDGEFVDKAESALKKMLPYRIGERGNLQEWYHDFADEDPHHRHQSHLFGLYPGHHISVDGTPAEANGAMETLRIKGDETTGWSTGWRVNLFARLKDGAKAYHMYRKLLNYISPDGYAGDDKRRGGGTYPNLLDAHSPFQIDGNFGGSAGVAEMLLQSRPDEIYLLPALPEQWRDGEVRGLCARGGYEVEMKWKDGQVVSAAILSKNGGEVTVHFNGKSERMRLSKGETANLRVDR